MCLHELRDRGANHGVGWKVLLHHNERTRTPYLKEPVDLGRWLYATGNQVLTTFNPGNLYSFDSYPTGWHVYENKADACLPFPGNRERAYRVRYRNVRARGYEYGVPVVVAAEIFVEDEPCA